MSCSDLVEKNPGRIVELNTEEELAAALGESYTILGSWGGNAHIWSLHGVSTDEMVVPQRGQDWFTGGAWIEAHRHTWTVDHSRVINTWNFLFQGVNATSRLIEQFEFQISEGADPSLVTPFISELRVLRGFYYFWLIDLFGNVPIIDRFAETEQNPANNSNFQDGRNELFEFIENEILESIDTIQDDPRTNYGRMHKYAAHFLLAKLYLNAEVYSGSPRWQQVITHTNEIIDSGFFSLASTYAENFAVNNSSSPEMIFVIPYDEVFLPGFNLHLMSLHYDQQSQFNFQDQPWNGFATLQEFYESFEEDDSRKSGLMSGPQYDLAGNPIIDGVIGPNHQLNLTPEIPRLRMLDDLAVVSREKGARFSKFEYEFGATSNMNNDFPIFRYTDVIMMKAEALWRLDSSDSEALMLINQIRERANVEPFSTLNADKFVSERGREFYLENWRRQDLIRFEGVAGGETRFNDPWWEKDVSQSYRNVYPIPRPQIEANPNLTQNPGY